jgi:hypothetical protein
MKYVSYYNIIKDGREKKRNFNDYFACTVRKVSEISPENNNVNEGRMRNRISQK